MKGKWFHLIIALALTLGSSSCAPVKQTVSDQKLQRAALAAKAFPAQQRFLYFDVPASDNGVSNLMMRAVIGEAAWMKQLTDTMARGASTPTYLVVGSRDNGVAYSAMKKALDSLKGKQLAQLHLVLVGDSRQAEQLRPAVESLGAEYRVLSSLSQ